MSVTTHRRQRRIDALIGVPPADRRDEDADRSPTSELAAPCCVTTAATFGRTSVRPGTTITAMTAATTAAAPAIHPTRDFRFLRDSMATTVAPRRRRRRSSSAASTFARPCPRSRRAPRFAAAHAPRRVRGDLFELGGSSADAAIRASTATRSSAVSSPSRYPERKADRGSVPETQSRVVGHGPTTPPAMSEARNMRRPRWMRDRTVPIGTRSIRRSARTTGRSRHRARPERGTPRGARRAPPRSRRTARSAPRRRRARAGAPARGRPGARRWGAASAAASRRGTRSSRSEPASLPGIPARSARGPCGPAAALPGPDPVRRRHCRPGGTPRCRGSARSRARPLPTWGHRQPWTRTTRGRTSSRILAAGRRTPGQPG